MSTTEEPLWESTSVQNLFRYRPSGTYFARFKVGGKPIRQSLDTAAFSVAKQRLPDKMREYRSRHESVKAFAHGKMTVGDAREVYLRKVRASASLKPRSKDYREMMIDFIGRSWPALFQMDVRKVSDRDCENWLTRYQQRYVASKYYLRPIPEFRDKVLVALPGVEADKLLELCQTTSAPRVSFETAQPKTS